MTDLSPVRALPGLKHLSCSATKRPGKLASLAPLAGMQLRQLDFRATRVSDLTPLEGMKLVFLECAGTRVSNLSPLAGMKLTRLGCAGTPVADLSPLKGMPLTILDCRGTRVSDFSPLKTMPLKELYCDLRPERDGATLRAIESLGRINGKPAAEVWKELAEKGPAPRP